MNILRKEKGESLKDCELDKALANNRLRALKSGHGDKGKLKEKGRSNRL